MALALKKSSRGRDGGNYLNTKKKRKKGGGYSERHHISDEEGGGGGGVCEKRGKSTWGQGGNRAEDDLKSWGGKEDSTAKQKGSCLDRRGFLIPGKRKSKEKGARDYP